MNFVFWLLIAIGLVIVWFALSPAFKPIGELIINIFNKRGED